MSEINQKEKKVRTLFIKVYDRRDSGFVRDDTQGTPFEERLNGPSKLNIPNEGFRKLKGGIGNERIRYIAGENEISKEEQKRKGLEPSGISSTDKIVIENGNMTIAEEGSTVGLFNYMNDVFYNVSNPDRSDKATALFEVIDLTAIEEAKNELDELQNEALAFVFSLQEKRGKEFIYQEERIDSLCELFSIFGERMPTKISALVGHAKMYPKNFLNKVAIFEQTAATIVAQSLQLNIIKFEENTAVYIGKNKLIKNLGVGKMNHDEKISLLSQYLLSGEGKAAYKELTAEYEFAKQQLEKK